MKRLNLKFLPFLLMLFGVFALSSCIGPRGPEGPPGRDGNANIFSIQYEVFANDWTARGVQGQPGYFLELELTVPEIDQFVVDNGLVLIYYQENPGDPWLLLPYTFISDTNPSFIELLDFIYGVSFVNLKSQGDDFNATPFQGIFRIIVADAIPINKKAIDYSNFEEVYEYFNLAEVPVIKR